MSAQDCEQLTLFPADSPVSRSALPGSAEARRMTATSGLRCFELFPRSDRLGSLVKTCLASSIWHSTRCWLTWMISATPRNRLLYRLSALMPRTGGSGSALWPTPTAVAWAATGQRATLQRMVDKGMMTEDEKRQLTNGSMNRINPEQTEWLMGYHQAFTEILPTPTATDYKGGVASRYAGGVHTDTDCAN